MMYNEMRMMFTEHERKLIESSINGEKGFRVDGGVYEEDGKYKAFLMTLSGTQCIYAYGESVNEAFINVVCEYNTNGLKNAVDPLKS